MSPIAIPAAHINDRHTSIIQFGMKFGWHIFDRNNWVIQGQKAVE
jgi:hypothetical protein